jgi:hypothetical protein
MKKVKGVTVTSCAPNIWKKLSNQQRIYWECFYRVFNEEANMCAGKWTKEQIEVVAHNMSCQAVWESARLGIIDGRKTARNK